MNNNIQVGEFYHFFDDGKTSPSRHYICKCEGIITVEESKELLFETYYWSEENNTSVALTLYDIWTKNKEQCPWLYDDDTPYFIVCSCPKYDDNLLYFVKTKSDGWFSMDVNSWWQSGELDIDSKKFNRIILEWEEILERHPDDLFARDRIKAHNETVY
jgi:hypothetical protein